MLPTERSEESEQFYELQAMEENLDVDGVEVKVQVRANAEEYVWFRRPREDVVRDYEMLEDDSVVDGIVWEDVVREEDDVDWVCADSVSEAVVGEDVLFECSATVVLRRSCRVGGVLCVKGEEVCVRRSRRLASKPRVSYWGMC